MHETLQQAKAICAVPAPTFAEGDRADLVADLFRSHQTDVSRDEAGNVLCALGPRNGIPPVVFAAHLDTVFGPEQPREIRDDGARVHAPGIGDNSLGVAALLHLARHFRSAPSRPLLLVATVGEEGLGDLRGAKALVASTEMAAFVAVEGMMLGAIKTGGIGSIRHRITYRGAGGHPWSDRGAPSAVHGLVERAATVIAGLAALDVSVNVGRIAGGTSINTIAAEAMLELDLRGERPELLAEASRRAVAIAQDAPAGLEAEIEQLGHRPSGAIAPDHPLLWAARRARAAAGLAPAQEGASSTDANAAYARGIPAITVGITTGGNAHRLDEYIDTEPVSDGLRALELLADELTN